MRGPRQKDGKPVGGPVSSRAAWARGSTSQTRFLLEDELGANEPGKALGTALGQSLDPAAAILDRPVDGRPYLVM